MIDESDLEDEIDHDSARDSEDDLGVGPRNVDPVRKTFKEILAKKLAERAKKKV